MEHVTSLSENIKLSLETCTAGLQKAMRTREEALQAEIAIILAVFVGVGEINDVARGFIKTIYSQSGYDCTNSTSKYYKYVNRRMNSFIALYNFIGKDILVAWAGTKSEKALILAVEQGLKTQHNFRVFDDILDYVDKPSNRTQKLPDIEGGEVEPAYKISVAGVHISFPHDVKPEDLVTLATKILTLAKKIGKEEHVVA